MKKLLFASALCATAAAFAADISGNTFDPANYTGFDGFNIVNNDVSPAAKNDAGADPSNDYPCFFCFATNGVFGAEAADESRVKAYRAYGGGESNLSNFIYSAACGVPDFFDPSSNEKYLDLSTSDGTLWRTVKPTT